MMFNRGVVERGLERIRLEVNDNGYLDPDYGHGTALFIRNGWNESCEMVRNTLSVDELKSLKFLIEGALEKSQQ